MKEDKRGRLNGWTLGAVVLVIIAGLITHGTFAGSGDEPHYLVIAHSLTYDFDLDVSNNYRDARLIGGGAIEPGTHVVERNGRQLPVHDIGMPLALSPLVWAAHQHAGQINRWLPEWFKRAARLNEAVLFRHWISLIIAVLTALLAVEMRRVLLHLGATSTAAFCWSVLFAATPPVLSHSFLFFTEIPTALLTLFVFRRLCMEPINSPAIAALLGVLTGYLLLIHIRNVGIVGGLLAVAVLLWRDRKLAAAALLAFAAGIAVVALGRTALNFSLWGTYVTTPHSTLAAAGSLGSTMREVFERITGLLFDRDFGLIGHAPIYVLAGIGLIRLWQQRPPLARDVSLVIGCYLVPVLLPVTNIHGWRGGWSPAARFLVPIVPLLWFAAYVATTRLSHAGRLTTRALIAIQIVMSAYLWQEPKTLWKDQDGSIYFPGSQWLPAWTDYNAASSFVTIAVAVTVCIALFMRVGVAPKGASGAS